MRLATIASTVVLAGLAIGDPIAQTLTVPAGADLQDALNRARPGDTIVLARGATYVGNNIRIHDNVFDGIERETWGGDGYFMLLSDAPRDVVIDHNTIVVGASAGIVKIAHGVSPNITFTNNLTAHGAYGIIGTGHGIGNDSIAAFLPGAKVLNNVFAGGNGSVYPAGNLFPSIDEFQRQFVDYGRRNYQLLPRSPWLHAGTDGRDLGADLSRVVVAPQRARQ
jgi:hypothetical protein